MNDFYFYRMDSVRKTEGFLFGFQKRSFFHHILFLCDRRSAVSKEKCDLIAGKRDLPWKRLFCDFFYRNLFIIISSNLCIKNSWRILQLPYWIFKFLTYQDTVILSRHCYATSIYSWWFAETEIFIFQESDYLFFLRWWMVAFFESLVSEIKPFIIWRNAHKATLGYKCTIKFKDDLSELVLIFKYLFNRLTLPVLKHNVNGEFENLQGWRIFCTNLALVLISRPKKKFKNQIININLAN